jgi:hypothetical protein
MNIEKHVTRLTKIGFWFSIHFNVRPFKIYFDHGDTPYREECQYKGKYDIEWKRLPYRYFLGHSVVKMKLFGIFTIYDLTKKKYKQWEESEDDEKGGAE